MDNMYLRFTSSHRPKSLASKSILLVFIALAFIAVRIGSIHGFQRTGFGYHGSGTIHSVVSDLGVRKDKFLIVPQIVWGLNNQKIAFARACLTARFLNRTLLMPSLSASLFYKEIDRLKPIDFDKIFSYDKFNSLCDGFVHLGRFSSVQTQSSPFILKKGEGRRWTVDRDLAQLKEHKDSPIDENEIIQIVGKNPFLWHDHWPVKDYARVFECLVLVDKISSEVTKVVSKLRHIGSNLAKDTTSITKAPYVAVHMRVEKDWMIHCKKLERKHNVSEICSSKLEIMESVSDISASKLPIVIYLAVADDLLEDSSTMSGWKEGIIPFDKKKLGFWDMYRKYPYIIQSAIDYEVCLRADVFVGNSFSTFSSLIVPERTQKQIKSSGTSFCTVETVDLSGASYAYNIRTEYGGPHKWVTNMSDSSLHAISYGTNVLSC